MEHGWQLLSPNDRLVIQLLLSSELGPIEDQQPQILTKLMAIPMVYNVIVTVVEAESGGIWLIFDKQMGSSRGFRVIVRARQVL